MFFSPLVCHDLLGAELEKESETHHCGWNTTGSADWGIKLVERQMWISTWLNKLPWIWMSYSRIWWRWRVMSYNFQALAWYLFADFLVIGAFRIYAPDFLNKQNILYLLGSSIVLWLIFDRKKKRRWYGLAWRLGMGRSGLSRSVLPLGPFPTFEPHCDCCSIYIHLSCVALPGKGG